ncbi:hypothetical protein GHT09_018211 [Marmota monax]|uniref:Uncharacterized protein n=1 Tax=Marmota monax TaxID=9995 RepID=A0A834PKX1_MARMO|nr:hypothetical protein GHT09_018211 [Marmota monax]
MPCPLHGGQPGPALRSSSIPRPPPATTCPVEIARPLRSLSTLRPPHSVPPANLPWPCVHSLPLLSITEGDHVATCVEALGKWLGQGWGPERRSLRFGEQGCLSCPGQPGPRVSQVLAGLPPLSLLLRAL